jgi:hypothetical protein
MNDKTLAFVIDGKVVRVLRIDEMTASIILSNPEVIDITSNQVTESWNYDPTKGFYVDMDGSEVVVPNA